MCIRDRSVQRSPLYTLVGETLAGTVTIRAYGDGERVLQQCLSLIDKANRAFIFLWCENRWLSIRVDVAGALVTFSAALFLLFGSADAALAGFTLSYAITLVDVVLWLVRLYSVVENIDSVFERMHYRDEAGALFKPVLPDLFADLGDDWAAYEKVYYPKGKVTEKQRARLIAFSKWVNQASDKDFAAKISQYIDLDLSLIHI